MFSRKDDDLEIVYDRRIKAIDFLWIFLFLLFFYLVIQVCLEQFFPNWDSFTFWAVDSKFLFENRVLRDVNFDVLRVFSYSSFYSFYQFLLYAVLGAIHEQFASIITVFFSLLSCLLIFKRIYKKSSVTLKSFLYLSLLLVPLIFLSIQNLLVTLYADVFCSFLVLLFTIVLLQRECNVKSYYKRVFLLSIVSMGVYFAKTPYMIITVFMLLTFFLYDAGYWIKNFRLLIRDKKLIITVLLLIIFFTVQAKYISQFEDISIIAITGNFIRLASLKEYVLYIQSIINLIISDSPYIIFLYIPLFSSLVFGSFRGSRRTRNYLVIIVLGTLSIPLFFYIVRLGDLTSKSLLRYMGLSFFSCSYALTFLQVDKKLNSWFYKYFIAFFILLVGIFFTSDIYLRYKLDFSLQPSSGKYKDCRWQESYYKLASKVEEHLSNDSGVFIIDETDRGLSNIRDPAIYVRYYLSNLSVGGQYTSPKGRISKAIEDSKATHILLLEYDGYWDKCSDLIVGETYLVQKDDLDFSKECPIIGISDRITP